MVIRSMKATSNIYCGSTLPRRDFFAGGCTEVAAADLAAEEVCPAGQVAFKCPLGPFSPADDPDAPRLAWAFEIVASVTGSLASCTDEGQVNQGTTKVGGTAATNPEVAPAPAKADRLPVTEGMPPSGKIFGHEPGKTIRYPAVGDPDWGADDYARQFKFKRQLPELQRIQWIDSPGVASGTFPSLDDSERFVSWLIGPKGECWCEFTFEHSWTRADNQRTGPDVVTLVSGFNCRLE
jgi:hypothetical protein